MSSKLPGFVSQVFPQFTEFANTSSRPLSARAIGVGSGKFHSTSTTFANRPFNLSFNSLDNPSWRLVSRAAISSNSQQSYLTRAQSYIPFLEAQDNIHNESPADAQKRKLKEFRKWEYTNLGRIVGTKSFPMSYKGSYGDGTRFTIMNYNVLAPTLLTTHKDLYRDCCQEALEWNYRKELFFIEILEFEPEIICLQEIEVNLYTSVYEPYLTQLGYKGVFKKRTNDKEDGCAIFYRSHTFVLIDKLDVDYYQPHVPLLNRDNIALLVKLESKSGRKPKIIVGTTHILYNPKRQDVKLAQVQMLLSELDRFAFSGYERDNRTSKYYPTILTGDFNADPYSSIVKFILEGNLRYQDFDGKLPRNLQKEGIIEFLPHHLGVTDQCQHYRVTLERYKRWRAHRKTNFEFDLKSQDTLVNLYNFSEDGMTKQSQIDSPKGESSKTSSGKSQSVSRTMSQKQGLTSDNEESFSISAQDKLNPVSDVSVGTKRKLNDSLLSAYEKMASCRSQTNHENVISELHKSGIECSFGSGWIKHNLKFKNVYGSKLDREDNNENMATTKQNRWTVVDYIFYSMTWHDEHQKLVEGQLKLLRRLGLMTRNQCREFGNIPNFATSSDHFPLVAEFVLK